MPLPLAKTVLLVEDEPLIVKFVRTFLEKAGYTVLAASSPKEAIRIDQESKVTIDLLLTGLSMLPISGSELAAMLKRRRPRLRVMLMSSDPAAPIVARANGWSFTSKPFAVSDLLNKIKNVFALGVAMPIDTSSNLTRYVIQRFAGMGGWRPWKLGFKPQKIKVHGGSLVSIVLNAEGHESVRLLRVRVWKYVEAGRHLSVR